MTGLPLPAAPVPQPAGPGPGIGPGTRLRRVLGPFAVAVLAAAAGAGLVVAFTGSPGGPAAAGSPSTSPRYLAPRSPASPGQRGGAPPGGGASTLFLVGRVTAVSSTSITIAAAGSAVTAAVTPSTRVSGRVASISGIRAGDHVSALISQNGGRATATAIAYPPEPPGGAGVP